MKVLDDYFKLQAEIYKYFGYEEDWVVMPINDRREFYWKLNQDNGGSGEVVFWISRKNVGKFTDDDGYTDEIYTQRFLPKYVYQGKDYTMICVDTHTDGNKFLAIYDNAKEIK